MALDTTNMNAIYDLLMGKAKETLSSQELVGRIPGADFAKVLSNSINMAMQLSVGSSSLEQDVLIKTKQAELLDKQIVSAGISSSNLTKQGELLDKQILKMAEDILLTTAQKDAIADQVIDNRRIKAVSSLGDTFGTMSANQVAPNAEMWAVYFNMVNQLETIVVPTTMTVSKVV